MIMESVWKRIRDYGGIGIGCMVFAVLLVLKVAGIVEWSWLWITAPLWFPLSVDVVLSVVYVVYNMLLARESDDDSEE